MLTEKQRIKKSIELKRKVIKTQKNLVRVALKFDNLILATNNIYLINKLEDDVIALETKLGIIIEKGRL